MTVIITVPLQMYSSVFCQSSVMLCLYEMGISIGDIKQTLGTLLVIMGLMQCFKPRQAGFSPCVDDGTVTCSPWRPEQS